MVKMIIGLGNPGSKYHEARYNIGFMIIDRLAKDFNITLPEEKNFKAEVGSRFINGEKVYLVKPTAFMNNSDIAVHALLTHYNIDIGDFLAIYDDLDMEVGHTRLRQKSSAGGRNGIRSIIAYIGMQTFDCIKVGIGRPKQDRSAVDHALGKFDQDDCITVTNTFEKVNGAAQLYLQKAGFIKTM